MDELTYHAKVIKVYEDGSILVMPVPFSKVDYRQEMRLLTGATKMYDRFGQRVDATYFRKNQWIKFITNGIMTMSLPPQLNPTILYEHIPMLEFEAEILEMNHHITLKVVDDCGSFVSGNLKLNFFEEPIVFDSEDQILEMKDLSVHDKVNVLSIVSFFTHEPLIELYRLEKKLNA